MIVRNIGRAALNVALRVIPPRNVVVVHGWGDGEENSLRVVGALSRELSPADQLIHLCEDPQAAEEQLSIALRHVDWVRRRVVIVRKNSLRGLLAYAEARVVFSTHGLFGNHAPTRGRLHVLLGHGHGPKSAFAPHRPLAYRSQLATTNNRAWGLAVIRDQGIPERSVYVTGNPRDDAFDEPADRARLARLGIDPARPLLLWLPTYRVPRNDPTSADLREPSEDARLESRLRTLRQEAQNLEVTVVTKAHQLDDQSNALRWGFTAIDTRALRDAGLSFFQLLGLADGLISDYSSVWVDFLRVARPTGLLFVDDAEFGRGRGFNSPTIREVASEIVLNSDHDVTDMLRRVHDEFTRRASPDARAIEIARRLGLRDEPAATDRVLRVVDAWLAARGARRLLRDR